MGSANESKTTIQLEKKLSGLLFNDEEALGANPLNLRKYKTTMVWGHIKHTTLYTLVK